MLCTECHTSNASDYKFCRECGGQLPAAPAAGTLAAEVEQLLSRAMSLLERSGYADAEAAALAALALDADNAAAHSVLSHIYERQGKVPQAIRELERVVARNPASTIDRARLEALRGNVTTSFTRSRWTPQQTMVASAAAASVIVFGGGIALINAQNRNPGTTGTRASAGTLQPIRSASVPPDNRALAGTPTRLPTPPTPLANQQGVVPPPLAAQVPAPPQVRATPLSTAPPRSAPFRPLPVPRPPAGAARQNPGGLPVAGIGEVVPLPQAPGAPPAATPPTGGIPGTVTPPAPGAPGSAAPAPASEPPKVVDSATEKPKRELLEPDSGFIRIEPIGAARETRAVSSVPKGPPPTISVDFASGGGDDASLEEAQRVQRSAVNAARRSDSEEAGRQYRRAAELFEILARRGGSASRQAREGLDACRKALASLR